MISFMVPNRSQIGVVWFCQLKTCPIYLNLFIYYHSTGPWTRGHQTRSWRACVLQSCAPTCLNTPGCVWLGLELNYSGHGALQDHVWCRDGWRETSGRETNRASWHHRWQPQSSAKGCAKLTATKSSFRCQTDVSTLYKNRTIKNILIVYNHFVKMVASPTFEPKERAFHMSTLTTPPNHLEDWLTQHTL